MAKATIACERCGEVRKIEFIMNSEKSTRSYFLAGELPEGIQFFEHPDYGNGSTVFLCKDCRKLMYLIKENNQRHLIERFEAFMAEKK